MGDDRERRRVTLKAFLFRFLLWASVIGGLAWPVSEKLWPIVYAEYGPPMHMFQEDVYYAVLFGAGVASVMGGLACAVTWALKR